MSAIELYKSPSGETQIEVKFENESVWLSLNQIAELFDRDKSVISRHLKNIFDSKELDKQSTVAKNATVQTEGDRRITREIEYYNLDVIISVGYRINSIQGTQFRIWATQRLKEYLIDGYSINTNRLRELNKIIEIIEKVDTKTSQIDEAKGILKILTDYTKSFILLNKFDSNRLDIDTLDNEIILKNSFAQ